MYAGAARHRQRKWPGSKPCVALGLSQYYFYPFCRPSSFCLGFFSLCLSLHILTLSSSGAVGGSGEEMTRNGTMEEAVSASCHRLETSSPLGALQAVSSCLLFYNSIQTWLTLRRKKGRNRDCVCMSLKQPPKGKLSRLYSSSYFKKDLDCIYPPLKM